MGDCRISPRHVTANRAARLYLGPPVGEAFPREQVGPVAKLIKATQKDYLMKKYLLLLLAFAGLFFLVPTKADAGVSFVITPGFYGGYYGGYYPAYGYYPGYYYSPYWYGGWHRSYYWGYHRGWHRGWHRHWR